MLIDSQLDRIQFKLNSQFSNEKLYPYDRVNGDKKYKNSSGGNTNYLTISVDPRVGATQTTVELTSYANRSETVLPREYDRTTIESHLRNLHYDYSILFKIRL